MTTNARSDRTTPVPTIRVEEIGRYISLKRHEENLSLAEAAEKASLSAATLSRLERQYRGEGERHPMPETKTLQALSEWLKVKLELNEGSADEENDAKAALPDVLDAYLRADRKLSPGDARVLSKMFRAAYDQFSNDSTK